MQEMIDKYDPSKNSRDDNKKNKRHAGVLAQAKQRDKQLSKLTLTLTLTLTLATPLTTHHSPLTTHHSRGAGQPVPARGAPRLRIGRCPGHGATRPRGVLASARAGTLPSQQRIAA